MLRRKISYWSSLVFCGSVGDARRCGSVKRIRFRGFQIRCYSDKSMLSNYCC